ncbi:MAG: nucleoside hydrolase [Clostridia bacterium]|nr:nucleoside hydrolase [Clostridia bacterium]
MRNFILGTDWGEDCDDAVAVRVLARSHKAGKINFIGVGINTHTEYSAPSLYRFLEREECIIPIGVDKNCPKTDWQNRYQPRLALETCKKDEDFEDAIRVYRRCIAEAEGKVEIIEIGFLQVLEMTLLSEGDDISPLSGMELFEKKVDKVWIMGGKWDQQGGREFNLSYTPFACRAASTVLEKCPCEITLLGWEIGARLITGNTLNHNDYLYQVLVDWGCPEGRESWDPMTAIMAVIGDENEAGYDTVRARVSVDPKTGANYFTPDESSNRKYVVKKFPDSYYSDMVNRVVE